MQPGQGIVADLPVEAAQGRRGRTRVGEQRSDRGQLSICLAQSAQCLDTGYPSGGGIDEWLKASERLPVDHGASSGSFGWSRAGGHGAANRRKQPAVIVRSITFARMQPDAPPSAFSRRALHGQPDQRQQAGAQPHPAAPGGTGRQGPSPWHPCRRGSRAA